MKPAGFRPAAIKRVGVGRGCRENRAQKKADPGKVGFEWGW